MSERFDDYGVIVGTSKAVFAGLTVGRAVIPRPRLVERRKFEDCHSFDLRSLEHLLTAIDRERRDRVTGHCGGGLFRVGLKLRRVVRVLAHEDYISGHVSSDFVYTCCGERGAADQVPSMSSAAAS